MALKECPPWLQNNRYYKLFILLINQSLVGKLHEINNSFHWKLIILMWDFLYAFINFIVVNHCTSKRGDSILRNLPVPPSRPFLWTRNTSTLGLCIELQHIQHLNHVRSWKVELFNPILSTPSKVKVIYISNFCVTITININ